MELPRLFYPPCSHLVAACMAARETLKRGDDLLLWLDCAYGVERDLATLGYLLFRGVRVGGRNIDLTAVGPNGVFVIEASRRGKKPYVKIVRDREDRLWPFCLGRDAAERARRHWKMLSRELYRAVGEAPVYPLLVLPGWCANRRGWGDIVLVGRKDYETITEMRQGRLSGARIGEIGRLLAGRSAPVETTHGEWDTPLATGKGAFAGILGAKHEGLFLAYAAPAGTRGPVGAHREDVLEGG